MNTQIRSSLILILGLFIASLIFVFVINTQTSIIPFDKKEEHDFGCGEKKLATIENENKLPKKTIYLVENLVKATPHLGCRMWNTYEKIAQVALEIYNEDKPKYQPVIKFFNEQAPALDPLRPAQIIDVTKNSDALITVGFAWSTMAGIASTKANKINMPYVSPTGVLKEINEGSYSVSLGINIDQIVDAYKYLLKNNNIEHVILTENTSAIHEREYAEKIRSVMLDSVSLHPLKYQSDLPTEKILELTNKYKNVLVVVPGYTKLSSQITDIIKNKPDTSFLVGPQWSHDHKLLDLEGKIFCISDYYNFLTTSMHKRVEKKWYEAGGDEIIGGYLFSLFDALYFSILALEETNDREAVKSKIKNTSFSGVKGKVSISKGTIKKNIYLLKFKNHHGFEFVNTF